ncbi:hypothetical protein JCM19235_6000 [Vibrio maritimus]|uniref:Uncharacterized protein n=1 Tax=Vibrio maritimus TaxID=990268 RepID=A0A090RQC5_9VIBR|nr:hypothetical protein JCM19235_6000 [Vibrio maritimus]
MWVLTTRAVNKQLLDILPENVSVLRIDPIDRLGRGFNINSPLDRWHLQIPIAE